MIVQALTLLVAAQVGAAADDYPPCNQAAADRGVQSAMNICAYNDYREADAEMNAVWKKAAARAKASDSNSDSSLFDDLLASQRAWLAYRDAQCALEANQYMGGSIMPLIRASCLRSLTEARTVELREYVEFPN